MYMSVYKHGELAICIYKFINVSTAWPNFKAIRQSPPSKKTSLALGRRSRLGLGTWQGWNQVGNHP